MSFVRQVVPDFELLKSENAHSEWKGPGSDEPAVAHGEGAVAEGGKGGIVGDDDDGLAEAVAQREEQAVDIFFGGGVEIAGGFVGKEHRGAVDQGAGDGDALLLSAGELAGIGVFLALQPHFPEEHPGVLVHLVLIPPVEDRRLGNVFHDRIMRKEVEILKHHPKEGAEAVELGLRGVNAVPHGITAVVKDIAAAGCFQEGSAAQHGRFSGAGGADDRYDIPLLDGERYILQNGKRAEGLLQTADLQQRGGRAAHGDL